MVAQAGGTQDLYGFRPPESNALRPVCAAVLFALICSGGYKWVREGARSQEEMKESSSWEEKEEVKSTSQPASRKDPALPFIKQGERVTLMLWDKPGERRRGRECA
jgi:hypothetical protein